VYTHAPTVQVFKDAKDIDRHYDRIYITGAKGDVQRAIEALRNMVGCSQIDLTLDSKFCHNVQDRTATQYKNRLDDNRKT
jgi:hypothetical protein